MFGLFAVIISWLMGSLYLASSVALGDLCMSPDGYIAKSAPSALAAEVFGYYTHCENARTNPFTQQLRDVKMSTDNTRRSLETVKKLAVHLFKDQQLQMRFTSLADHINTVDKQLNSLTTFLDCKPLHKQYVHAAKSLCHLGLYVLVKTLFGQIGFFDNYSFIRSANLIYV